MTIPILINGAFGRMGQMTSKAISEHPEFELVGEAGRAYDLKKSIKDSHAKIVIDFTTPEAVFNNTLSIIEAGAHPIIGTTGLSSEQIELLKTKCADLKLGGMIVPNFSLGAVLMMKYAREIAQYLPQVEIIEMHHDAKIDSPSGTALRTAELIATAIDPAKTPAKKISTETVPGARGALYHGIPIHSVRLPGFLAHEQIIFGDRGQTLTLRHDSMDRICFMPGIFLACKKVLTLESLVVGLEAVI